MVNDSSSALTFEGDSGPGFRTKRSLPDINASIASNGPKSQGRDIYFTTISKTFRNLFPHFKTSQIHVLFHENWCLYAYVMPCKGSFNSKELVQRKRNTQNFNQKLSLILPWNKV